MKLTKKQLPFEPKVFLSKVGEGRTISKYAKVELSIDKAILRIRFFTL